MIRADFQKYRLHFKRPSGTSRGILTYKDSWFIVLHDPQNQGIGECGLLKGLSYDDRPDYESRIRYFCDQINEGKTISKEELYGFPSIRFGLEMAFMDLSSLKNLVLFPSAFTRGEKGIDINGLVWMGDFEFMKRQITEKINQGFTCIKIKIGAIDFDRELELLKYIRKEFSVADIEIRTDANGAFQPENALDKLKRLSEFDIHSIEQPIRQGQAERMAELCTSSPVPIALDEELIGKASIVAKKELLETIKPQYIILKPSLVGGFEASKEWIDIAEKTGIGWWVTSALESNIGLNAIAQWTYTLKNPLPQGLGTGMLYSNNINSPLKIDQGKLFYQPSDPWELNNLL